jgi:hypothetical protein
MTDPMAFWRGSNFEQPRSPARLIALGLLVIGIVMLATLAVIVMRLQLGGAVSVCGFAF